ncbi:MAG: acyl-[acyl-carrier-protein]--UDP-N-acetylglucosamine O-acyltransferase [Bacteroidetes bacterium]|nr:acyl-[acyl-carrier-protein]--UDP-N-acetylglucosamine O-acyltransferase [Bacteroidota bacterium]
MIHSLAFVHPDAKIGKNVKIDPFAYIEQDVEIGDDCWVGSNASILSGARIGKSCKIFQGAVIAAIPQDLKFNGEESYVIIGNHTTVREHATINRGTKAGPETKVGSHCLIMAYAHVAHDCVLGDHVILANAATLAGHVEIGDWAIIGGLCAVHQFVKIGAHTLISGGSLVRKDVPPYIKAASEPLAYAGINSIGLSRRDYNEEQINNIASAYRILYQQGLNISQAASQIQSEFVSSPEIENILSFINESDRGLIKKRIREEE